MSDQAVTQAWMTAKFSGMKQLEPLAHYLSGKDEEVQPNEATAEDLRAWAARWKLKPTKPS